MPPKKQSSESRMRKAILLSRQTIIRIAEEDANEAETRKHVMHIFERVMGYDGANQLSFEHAIRGIGDTDHVDLAVQLDHAKPIMLVELKRVRSPLLPKYIKKAHTFAVDLGCEWVILTNGREWQIYHITFGQPPDATLVESWNLLEDGMDVLIQQFGLLCLKQVRKNGMAEYWRKRRVLEPSSLLGAMFSKDVLNAMRRALRKKTKVRLPIEQIAGGLRPLLNGHAMDTMRDYVLSSPKGSSRQGHSRSDHKNKITLKELIDQNILTAPLPLFSDYKGTRLTATLHADGTIEFDGSRYDNPSKAGSVAKSRVLGRPSATPGWDFWSYVDQAGKPVTLTVARSRMKSTAVRKPAPQ